jgi:lipopolysaccharide/colanic/teichoic acid biosynthesis glycosyltransferase
VASYAALAALAALVAFALGFPDEPRDTASATGRAVICASLIVGVASVGLILVPDAIPRFVLLATGVLLVPVLVATNGIARVVDRRARSGERVLAVLSDEERAVFLADASAVFPEPELPFTVVDAVESSTVRDASNLVELAEREAVTLLVLGAAAQDDEQVVAQAARLHAAGIRVRSMVGFYDEWLGKLPLSEVTRLALMTDISSVHGDRFGRFKRMVDLAAGCAGLIVLASITPLVLCGNLVANRGSLLFRQRRIGLGGREFVVLKLRTMRNADGDDVSSWTSPDDPRVTPFGYVLRRTHLDELPQAINMIKGSLSLVGPRPEQPRYVAELTAKMPMYEVRHIVKPGLTGWAQIKFRYAASEADAFEKLQYDLHYIRHQSVTVDVKVVLRTVRRVLLARGR